MLNSPTFNSPSPTLSPNPSFSAALRRSTGSYRLSPASRHVATSPTVSIREYTPTSAPKAEKKDAYTQYTPKEYPPTAGRLMTSASVSSASNTLSIEGTNDNDPVNDAFTRDEPPQELSMRCDPGPHTPSDGPSCNSLPPGGDVDGHDLESPAKRAKGESTVKIMPLDYMKCDIRDLGIVIADMLMELIRINDPLPFKNEQLTRYHSRAPPGISVHDYLNRLIVHATLAPPILLSLVYYIDKLSALYPVFNISSLTVHRYLITTATVAAKGLSDSFWTNNTYARVGGISVKELALLELDFLERMDWKIVPPADILDSYYRNLVDRSDGYKLEEGPITAIER